MCASAPAALADAHDAACEAAMQSFPICSRGGTGESGTGMSEDALAASGSGRRAYTAASLLHPTSDWLVVTHSG